MWLNEIVHTINLAQHQTHKKKVSFYYLLNPRLHSRGTVYALNITITLGPQKKIEIQLSQAKS